MDTFQFLYCSLINLSSKSSSAQGWWHVSDCLCARRLERKGWGNGLDRRRGQCNQSIKTNTRQRATNTYCVFSTPRTLCAMPALQRKHRQDPEALLKPPSRIPLIPRDGSSDKAGPGAVQTQIHIKDHAPAPPGRRHERAPQPRGPRLQHFCGKCCSMRRR